MRMNPNIRTHSLRKFKHSRSVAVALLVLTMTACSAKSRPKENVVPPQPGIPAQRSDVQGIYRTVHQALLQLRGDGDFVMIVPEGPGPSGGRYTLADGTLSVRTDDCGSLVGEYRVVVNGPPKPGKASLVFTPVKDDCGERQKYLTIDPWIYANS